MNKYFTSQYLFQINTVMLQRIDKIFFIIGAVFTVLAIVLKIAAMYAPSPVDRKVRNRFYHLFLTIGLSELVWFAARYEHIMFFGSHFVALLVLLIGLVWFGFIVKYLVAGYKTDRTAYEKEQLKLKYLPK